jgi:hypothetical protein
MDEFQILNEFFDESKYSPEHFLGFDEFIIRIKSF